MYTGILVENSGGIATISLNREAYSNALARETYGEIRDAVETLSARDDVKVIVITGKGKHFSAGGDIKRFKTLIENKEYLAQEAILYAGQMSKAIKQCKVPVIAMVNGVATGAGFSLALACDYRFVSPSSKLIMGFVRLGLPGDTGSIYLLPKLVGIEKASQMMMTGDIVGGEEAYKIGLATQLTGEDDLEEKTYAFAKKLASMPKGAIAKQKSLLYNHFYKEMDVYLYDESLHMAVASREPDFEEAVNAFLEKRQPVFK